MLMILTDSLSDLSIDKKIVVKELSDYNTEDTAKDTSRRIIYGASYYYMEMAVAYALKALDVSVKIE